jgi:hypothetical protein
MDWTPLKMSAAVPGVACSLFAPDIAVFEAKHERGDNPKAKIMSNRNLLFLTSTSISSSSGLIKKDELVKYAKVNPLSTFFLNPL